MRKFFIGIDLAWGEKNLSGLSVLEYDESLNNLTILAVKLLKSIDEIVQEILKYQEHMIYVGVDAPLVVSNKTGNRQIEKEFNALFAQYKISMLPVNRVLLTKYTETIRSETLFLCLKSLGFQRDFKANRVIFEVYPHSTIASLWNNQRILPYKRKQGRDTSFIKEQLLIYKTYLQNVLGDHSIFDIDIEAIKGIKLKDYEDMLDALTCAYSIYYCFYFEATSFEVEGVTTFVTPKVSAI